MIPEEQQLKIECLKIALSLKPPGAIEGSKFDLLEEAKKIFAWIKESI